MNFLPRIYLLKDEDADFFWMLKRFLWMGKLSQRSRKLQGSEPNGGTTFKEIIK